MEETKIFKKFSFLIILLMNMLCLNGAKSEVYTVGDGDEWSTGTNYLSWSEKYNFSVGNVLVFKYVKGQHNTYEVTEATFQSCDASSGVVAKYESGDDQVKLTEAKKYWFICDIAGHCLGGMRFGINVKVASATSNNNTINGAPTPEKEPTPPANPNKSYDSKRPSIGIYLVALVILFKMYC